MKQQTLTLRGKNPAVSGASARKKYKLVALIGRFTPNHRGHMTLYRYAASLGEHVLVLLGSSYRPRTPNNPFTWEERTQMIHNAFREIADDLGPIKVSVSPIRDFIYSDPDWEAQVDAEVRTRFNILLSESEEEIDFDGDDENAFIKRSACIIGNNKDESTYYLERFPQFSMVDIGSIAAFRRELVDVDATRIREAYFRPDWTEVPLFHRLAEAGVGAHVPQSTFSFLEEFEGTPEFQLLVRETKFKKDNIALFSGFPFNGKIGADNKQIPGTGRPINVATDSIFYVNGHVLLVKRKNLPGIGTWALPGGFLDPDEELIDCALREPLEEARVKVDPNELKNVWLRDVFHFASKKRYEGGVRKCTFAHMFVPPKGYHGFPFSRADRVEVGRFMWLHIGRLDEIEDQTFEDHRHIIKTMVRRWETRNHG